MPLHMSLGWAITSSVFAISSLVVVVVAAQVVWGWIFARGIIAGEKASATRRSFSHCPWFPQIRRWGRELLVYSWFVLLLGGYVKLPSIVTSLAAWVLFPCGLILCAVGIVWHGRVMCGPDLHRGDRMYHAGCVFAWTLGLLACWSLVAKLVTGAGVA